MKSLIPTLAMLAMTTVLSADILAPHQWKHRVLIVPQMSPPLERQLMENAAGIEERDVVVRVLKGRSKTGELVKPEDAAKLRERFGLNDANPEIVLLGKDGRTTVRWKIGKFTLESLYARIDAMPMRQREMRKQR